MSSQTFRGRLATCVAGFVFLISTEIMPYAACAQQIASTSGTSGASAAPEPASTSSTSQSSQPGAAPLPAGFGLNLGTTLTSMVANISQPVQIRVGGKIGADGTVQGGRLDTINPGQAITPSVFTVLQQLTSGHAQTLMVEPGGRSVGGYIGLTPSTAAILDSINVPANVAALGIGFTSASPLNVTNLASISGALFALQPQSGTTSVLNFGDLTVNTGGLVSGYMPSNMGFLSNLFASAGMTLNVGGTLTNHGTITAPGMMNVNAGTIVNQSIGANVATMKADSMSLFSYSGNILNSGLIQAMNNLDITAPDEQALSIMNTGGTLKTLTGDINFRNQAIAELADVTVVGGDLIAADSINMFGRNMEVHVNELQGELNQFGSAAHVTANTADLVLGTITLTGDPTWWNTGGSVTINSAISINSGDVAILAASDVFLNADVNVNANDTNNGDNILIVAGASLSVCGLCSSVGTNDTNPFATDVTINGPGTGGSVIGGGSLSSLYAGTTTNNASGGDVTVIAYGGSVNLNGASINVRGDGNGSNGNVLIIGETGVSNIGAITANVGSSASRGSINLAVAQVNLSGPITVNDGTVQAGSGSFSVGNPLNGALTLTSTNVQARNAVNLLSGGNITLSNAGTTTVTSTSSSVTITGGGSGQTVSISGNTGVNLTSGTTTSIINDVTSGNASGGVISVTSSGGAITGIDTISANGNGTGGGGTVTVDQNSGAVGLDLTGTSISANAGGSSGGSGGSISIFERAGKGISLDTSVSPITVTASGGATGGAGGSINIDATLGGTDGAVDFNNSTSLTANATGAGAARNGGTITIAGSDITGAKNLQLQVNATGTGNGGTVNLTTTGNKDIVISGANGAFNVSAKGGSAASTAGDGGILNISSGAKTTINTAQLNLNPQGTNGNGGQLSVTASTNTAEVITITGNLNLNGAGTGTGGVVSLVDTGAAKDITTADITVNGGTTGAGNSININSARSISTGNLSANGGTAQGGGSITLSAGSAGVAGDVNVSGAVSATGGSAGNAGNGGTISVTYSSNTAGEDFTIGSNTGAAGFIDSGAAGTISVRADALGSGTGGGVTFANQNTGGTATLDIMPDASGNRGTITAGSNSGTAGSLTFSKAGRAVTVQGLAAGEGNLVGGVIASGSSVLINPRATNSVLSIRDVDATATTATLTADGAGSTVSLLTVASPAATAVTTLAVTGDSGISGTGLLQAATVTLATTDGHIGAVGARIQTDATNLSAVAAGTNRDVFINEASGVTINAVSSATRDWNLTTAANGGVVVGANVNAGAAAGTLTIQTNGTGTITTTGGRLSGNTVNLSTTGSGSIGTVGTPVLTGASNLAATIGSGTGGVFLSNNLAVNLNASSSGSDFNLQNTAGSVTIAGNVTGGAAAGNTITINVSGANSIVESAGRLSANTVNLATGNGNIGAIGNPILIGTPNIIANAAAAGNNVFLSDNQGVAIAGASQANGGTFSLTTTGAGPNSITDTGNFTITASTVTLATSAGSLGSSTNPILTAASTINTAATTAASTDVYVTNSANATFSDTSTNLHDYVISNNGPIAIGTNITSTVAGGQIRLTTTGAGPNAITDASNSTLTTTGSGSVTLTTSAGSIGVSGTPVKLATPTITANANGAATSVFLTDSQAVNIGAASQANGGTFQLATTGAGSNITNTGNFTITATTADFGTVNGNIGSVGNPMLISAAGVIANAATAGNNVFISDNLTVNIAGASQANTGTFQLVTTGANHAITDTGAFTITASTVNLTATGSIGVSGTPIKIAAPTLTANATTASTNVFITDNQSVNIGAASQANGGTFQLATTGAGSNITNTGNFTITATTADFGTVNGNIGSLGNPMLISASGVIANAQTAGNNVFISDNLTVNVAANSQANGGTFQLVTTGANHGITDTGAFTITASTVNLTATGSMGVAGTPIKIAAATLTANATTASTNVFITDSQSVNLGAASQANGGTFQLATTGAGSHITDTLGVAITASTVDLQTANGNIGVIGTPIKITAANLTANAAGAGNSVFISDSVAVNISSASQANSGTFHLDTTGVGANITDSTASVITASTVDLVTTSGNIGVSGTPIQTSASSITTSAGGASGDVVVTNAANATFSDSTANLHNYIISNAGPIAITTNITSTIAGGQISLTTTGAGANPITDVGGFILTTTGTGSVSLTTSNGSIGGPGLPVRLATPTVTANATGAGTSVFLSDSQTVNLGGNSQANGGTFQLATSGAANITNTGNFTVTAGTADFSTANGNIGSVGNPILLSAANVIANAATAGNNVFLSDNLTVAIAGNSQANAGTFQLVTTGANHSITDNGGFTVTGATVNLSTASGAIGVIATNKPVLTVAGVLAVAAGGAGNDAFISEADSVTLNASSAGATFRLDTTGAGSNININGSITVGAASGDLVLNTPASGSITVATAGNILQAPAGNVAITSGTVTTNGNAFDVRALNDITLTLSGGSPQIDTTSATAGGLVNLQATNGNIIATGVDIITDGAGGSNAGNVTATAGVTLDIGNISANGGPTGGQGGTVTLSLASALPYIVGATTTISANGGTTTGNGGTISITNTGAGGITLNNAASISAVATDGTGGQITLDATAGAIDGPINLGAGASTLTVQPITAGAGGQVTLRASDLSFIGNLTVNADAQGAFTGGTITVVTTSAVSDITLGTLAGQLNLSASPGGTINVTAGHSILAGAPINMGTSTLNLTAIAGNIGTSSAAPLQITCSTLSVTANAAAVGNGNAWVEQQTGSLAVTASSVNKQMFITTAAAGDITVSGALTGNDIQLTTIAGGGGDIILNANVGTTAATSNVTLSADGSITGAGTVAAGVGAGTVGLASTTGTIGTSAAARISTAANALSLSAPAAAAGVGNAWINEANAVTLNASSTNKQMFVTTLAAGDITIGGALTGNDIQLTTFATGGGNIVLNANVGSAAGTQVILTADGSITGAGTVAAGVGAGLVSLNATTGNIGSSSAARVATAASTLALSATAATVGNGNAWVNEANAVTFNASTVNKQMMVNTLAAGNMSVSGALSGNDIQLTTFAGGGGSITLNAAVGTAATANVAIVADGSINGASTVSAGAGAGTIALTATTGNIGTNAAARISTSALALTLTANAGSVGNGNAFINEANAVTMNASSVNKQMLVNTLAAGVLTVSGALTGNDIQLTTFAGGGGGIVLNANVGTVAGTTNVTLAADGSITGAGTVAAGVGAGTVNLTSTTGNIGTSAAARISTAATALALTANAASLGNGNAFINEANAVTMNASSVNKQMLVNTLAAGNLTVSGALTGNDIQLTTFASGGGNIAVNNTIGTLAGTTNVTLLADGSITGNSLISAGVAGGTIGLTATTGNIGASAASRVSTSATALTLTANAATVGNGNAWVNEANAVTLNASSTNKQMFVNTLAAGNLTVGGALTGDDIQLTTFAGGGGGIVLSANVGTVGGTTNVTLNADGSITGAGTVAAGIGAGTVNLASTTGNVGTAAAARISTAANALSLTANAATVGNGNAWVNEANAVTVNASSVDKQMLVNTLAAGNLTVGGSLAGDDIQLTTFATGGGNVILNANVGSVGGTTNVTINADGSVTGASQVAAGVGAGTVVLTATTGNIGSSSAARVSTAATALTLTANAATVGNGNAWVNEADAVSMNASSVNKQMMVDTQAAGNLTVAGALTGNDLQLTTFAGGAGNIILNASVGTVGATANVALVADGSITGAGIVAAGSGAGTVALTATTGNIGASAAARISTAALALTLNANAVTLGNGNAWVNEANAVTLNASSVDKQMFVNTLAAGVLTVGGALSGDDIQLTTFAGGGGGIVLNAGVGTVGGTSNVTLVADGSITGAGTVAAGVGAGTVSLTSTTGNIGSSAAARISTAATALALAANAATVGNGNAFINEADAVSMNASSVNKQMIVGTQAAGNLTVAGALTGNDIQLTTFAGGAGSIVLNNTVGTAATTNVALFADGSVNGASTVTAGAGAGTVALTATTGNIGSSSAARVSTAATALTLTANAASVGNGNAWVNEANAVSMNVSSVNKQMFVNTQSAGNLTVAGALTGNDIQLTTFAGGAGNIVLNANVGTAGTTNVALAADGSITGAGTVSAGAGAGTVALTSTTGNIGTAAATRISTAATALTLTANAATVGNGNAWINEANAVTMNASSVNKQMMVNTLAAGSLTVAGALTGDDIQLTTFAGGAGNIVVNNSIGTVGGTTNVNLTADGSITGAGTIAAGLGAGTVALTSTTGNIGSNAGARIATAANALTLTANAAAVGNGNAWIDEANGVSMNASSVNKQMFVNTLAAGNLTVAGALNGDDIRLTTFAGGAGNIILNNTVGTVAGTTNVALTADGSIIGASTVAAGVGAGTVSLTATTGNIGTSAAARVSTSATALTLTANAATVGNGNAFVNEANAVSLNASSVNKQMIVNTLAAGNLTVAGALTGDDIQVTTFAGGGGGIVLNANVGTVGGTTNVALVADGSITGAGTVAAGVGAGTVALSSTTGNIGTSSAARISTAATILTLTANAASVGNGNAFINEANAVSMNASSVNKQMLVNTLAAGALTVAGALTGNDLQLTTFAGGGGDIVLNANVGTVGGTTNVALVADGSITGAGTVAAGVGAGTVALSSTTGNIGASSAARISTAATILTLTANAATVGNGNAFINEANAVSMNASSVNKQMLINTLAAGNLTVLGALTGNDIQVTTFAGGNGNIILSDDVGLTGSTTNVTLTADGSITGTGLVSAGVGAGTVVLTANNGNIGSNAGARIATAATALTLTANAATVGNGNAWINEADAVSMNASSVNKQMLVTTNAAGNLTVAGALTGDDLQLTTFAGGGGGIILNANVGTVAGTTNVNLTADGSITGAGTVAAGVGVGSVFLTSTTGNIGANAATRISTAANALDLTANAATVGNGNAWINEADGVSLNASSVNKQMFVSSQAAGNMTVVGALTGDDIRLTTFAGGAGNIILNAAVGTTGGTTNVNLTADGSITGASTVSAGVGAGTVMLTSTTGNVGTSAAARVSTAALNLTLSANAATVGNGNAWVNEANAVTMSASSVNKQMMVNTLAAGDLTIAGAVTGNDIQVTTFNAGNGNIFLNAAVGDASTANVVLSADGALTGASFVTTGTGTDSVTLLASGGNVGTSPAAPVQLSTGNLTVNNAGAGNDVYVTNNRSLTINGNSSAAGDFDLRLTTASNTLIVNNTITAGGNVNVNLNTSGAAGSGATLTNNSTITTSGAAATLVVGATTGNVTVDGTAGVFSVTGGGASQIQMNSPAVLSFGGTQTYTPGATGLVSFTAGTQLVNNAASIQTVSNGTNLNITTPAMLLGNASNIRTLAGATNIDISSPGAMTLDVADGSSAAITGAAGAGTFAINPGSTLTFGNAAGSLATLSLAGKPVDVNVSGNTTVNSDITVQFNNSPVWTISGNSSLVLNGTIQKTTAGGSITIQSPGGNNLTLTTTTGTGAVNYSAAGANTIDVISGNNLTLDNGIAYDPFSATGAVNFSTASGAANNITINPNGGFVASTIGSGADLNITTNNINFGNGGNLTATGASVVTIQNYAGNDLTFTGSGAVNLAQGTIATTNGTIDVFTNQAGDNMIFANTVPGGPNITVINLNPGTSGNPVTLTTTGSGELRVNQYVKLSTNNAFTISGNQAISGTISQAGIYTVSTDLIILNAGGGIEAGGFAITNATAAGLTIQNSGGAVTGGFLVNSATGDINISSSTSLTFVSDSPVATTINFEFSVPGATGQVNLTSNTANGGGDLTITDQTIVNVFNSGSPATLNNLNLTANGANIVTAGSITATGNIVATANNGSLNNSTGSLVSTGGNFTANLTNGVLNNTLGLIESQGANGFILVNSLGTLDVGGGTFTTSGAGAHTLSFVSTGSQTVTASMVLNGTAAGTALFQGSSLTFNSGVGVTQNGGGQMTLSAADMTFNNGSAVTVNTAGGTALLLNANGGAALSIDVPAGATATFTTLGAGIATQLLAGEDLNMISATGTLNIVGGDLVTTTSGANTNISMDLASNRNLTFNVDNGVFTNDGNISTTLNGGAIIVQSTGFALTVDGVGSLGFAGAAAGTITVQADAGNMNLTYAGSQTYSAGAGGSMITRGDVITLNANQTERIASGATVTMTADVYTLNNGSQLLIGDGASVNLNSRTGALTFNGSGPATIARDGGVGNLNIVATVTGINSMLFSNALTIDAGPTGTLVLNAATPGASIDFAAGATQTILSGTPITVATGTFTFGNASGLNATGASNILVDSGAQSVLMTVAAGAANVGLMSAGGLLTLIPQAGQSITLAKTAGANAVLTLGGALNMQTSAGGVLTIDPGLTLQTGGDTNIVIAQGALVFGGLSAGGSLALTDTAALTDLTITNNSVLESNRLNPLAPGQMVITADGSILIPYVAGSAIKSGDVPAPPLGIPGPAAAFAPNPIILTSNNGQVVVDQDVITGTVRGTAQGDFRITARVSDLYLGGGGVGSPTIQSRTGDVILTAFDAVSNTGGSMFMVDNTNVDAFRDITLAAFGEIQVGNVRAYNYNADPAGDGLGSPSNPVDNGGVIGAGVVMTAGRYNPGFGPTTDVLLPLSILSIGTITIDNLNPANPGQQYTGAIPVTVFNDPTRSVIFGDRVTLTAVGGLNDHNNRNNLTNPPPGDIGVPNNGTVDGGVKIATANSMLAGLQFKAESYGGDVSVNAANNILMSNYYVFDPLADPQNLSFRNVFQSIAKRDDDPTLSMSVKGAGGFSIPLHSGGRVGVFAGVPTTNVPQVLFAWINSRSNKNPILQYDNGSGFEPKFTNLQGANGAFVKITVASSVNVSGAGSVYKPVVLGLSNQAIINNNASFNPDLRNTIAANGGIIFIDPPSGGGFGSQFFINLGANTIFNAVAPAIPPQGGGGGGGTTIGGFEVQVTIPTFSVSGVSTDSTRTATVSLTQQVATLLDNNNYKKITKDVNNNTIVATGACQPMFLEDDDDTMMVGESGTTLSAKDKRSVDLKQGKIIAMVGKQAMKVETKFGNVQLAGNSAAMVQQSANGVVRVANLSGQATSIQVNRNGKMETLVAEAGEELVIADDALADEEMIAVDGVDREPVSGAITIPGMKVAKNRFDQKMMMDKERLLVCNTGSFYMMRKKIEGLKKDVDKNAKPLKRTYGSTTKTMNFEDVELAPQAALPMPELPAIMLTPEATVIPEAGLGPLSDAPTQAHMQGADANLVPIAYMQPATIPVSSRLRTLSTNTALLKHNGKADLTMEHDGAILNLKSGEVLVSASHDTLVKTEKTSVAVKAGSIALVSVKDGVVKVRAMWETGPGTVRQHVGDKCWDIAAGQETILGTSEQSILQVVAEDGISRRKPHFVEIPGGLKLHRCEISMVNLMIAVDFLSAIVSSESAQDKQMTDKFVKMAAILNQVTGRHGQYQQIQAPH